MKIILPSVLFILALYSGVDIIEAENRIECFTCVHPTIPKKCSHPNERETEKAKIKTCKFDADYKFDEKESHKVNYTKDEKCLSATVTAGDTVYLIKDATTSDCKKHVLSILGEPFKQMEHPETIEEKHVSNCELCESDLCNGNNAATSLRFFTGLFFTLFAFHIFGNFMITRTL